MFSCISPCKLNLFLYITGKRADGYHNLQSLFAILDYGDVMSFEKIDEPKLILEGPFDFPLEQNLIYKAYMALKTYTKKEFGIKIKVEKKIPQGGGLGGGSSNAATCLVVCNQLFNLNINNKTLCQIGSKLGADVPIFVNGHCAFAQGIGDELEDYTIDEKYYLVICPNIKVSTKDIFTDPDLKCNRQALPLKTLLSQDLSNDLEPIAIKKFPKIGHVIAQLVKYGRARMSGSGASCFLETESLAKAQEIMQELSLTDCTSFIAKAINTSTVHQALNKLF